ncbi:hypothetical protein O181_091785 [Austropuccinia psidii MF-1]|uniref:Uncharacterized protein n=1 Tax=Austropuccinia psidii MF-1 TaxID=1389203 RepID=A0A9Q3IYF9_9BASI|nr:hypothetical protein [Austropuccinia psidii MF-1]
MLQADDGDFWGQTKCGLDTSMKSNSNTSDSESWAHRPSVEDFHNKVEDMPMKSASKEINGGISITQDGCSPKKNAGPQHNLPEKIVSNKPQSVMSILEHRLDLQENQRLEHMKSQMLYQNAQDEKTGELKLLEIRENKAIKEMELNYQCDIQVEKNKYRYAQEERAAELHWAQLQFQQEELDLKKVVAKQNNRQMEESGKRLVKEWDASSVCTHLEFDFKNKELEQSRLRINLELQQSQQQINHEIGAALRAEHLATITQMHKDGMSQDEIEKNVKIIFDT